MGITLDDFLATLPSEQQAEVQKITDRLLVPGKAVKVTDAKGKVRDGTILAYGYKGNVTGLHYWLAQVKGLKKAKLFSEDKITAS